jgi:oligopeptide transport system substrate-binding protein
VAPLFVPNKKIAVIGALSALLVFMAWAAYTSSSYTSSLQERPFNAGVVGKVSTLDPSKVTTHEEKLVASTLYEGLVYYDEDARSLKPRLAKDWKISADGRKLTIELKRNILFHNGKQLTAADVKTCWEKALTEAAGGKASLFLPIEGSDRVIKGAAADLAGLKIVDRYTLVVAFSRPDAAFVYHLTNPAFWIRDTEDKADICPGTGPFKFKERNDKSIVLTRHDKYHRERPALTEIQFSLYQDANQALQDYKARKLDYLDQVPLKEVKNIREASEYNGLYTVKPIQAVYFLGFNVNQEPFADNFMLRRALNYAIDRQAIIDNITGGLGQPLKGALPLGLPGYNKDMRGYSYDPEQARNLLAQAGYPDGQGLKPLTLTYNKSPGHQQIAEVVAAQLGQLGVQVELKSMDWKPYVKELEMKRLKFFRLGWAADYPDVDAFLYPLYHSSRAGVSNFTGYHNPQADKILDASRAETKSVKERINLLRRAEEIIVDDAPVLWLFQQEAFKIVGPDVNGFKLDSMEMVDWYSLELKKPELEKQTSMIPEVSP